MLASLHPKPKEYWERWAIPLLYASILFALSPLHSVFNEWGGVMQYFAGREILAGAGYHGWTSHFWPPLFSILIAMGSMVAPGFVAGKATSIGASALLLFIAYHFALELFGSRDIALWAQIFLALNPLYVYESLQAHNHMLDSLLFILGLLLFVKGLKAPTAKKLFMVGLICGLAGLTRYTSYVLLALPLMFFFTTYWRKAASLAIAFGAGFTVISLPWWSYNLMHNGSPFHSWEYLNVCAAVVPGNVFGRGLRGLWWCASASGLNSLQDIWKAYPYPYLYNFLRNVLSSVGSLIRSEGALAPFLVPALLESIIVLKPRQWFVLWGELALSIFLVSQAYVLDYYLLSWTVPLTIVTTAFLLRYLTRCESQYPLLKRFALRSGLIALIGLTSLGLTALRLTAYANERHSSTALADLAEVATALKKHDSQIQSKFIMALDPARAYYVGAKFLATPLIFEGTVEDMVQYAGLDEAIKTYAPKYPAQTANSELKANYLIYTRTPRELPSWELQDLSQFAFLFDHQSDQVPGNFKLVYQSATVVAYEINWDAQVKK